MRLIAPLLSYASQLKRLKRNVKLTRAELEKQKLAQFRKLVRHAQRRSPYYRDLIRARNIKPSKCTPSDFPVLTKSDLIEHFDAIVTDKRITKSSLIAFLDKSRDPKDLYLGEFIAVHTSGSSGHVGYFVFSQNDWYRGLAGSGRIFPMTGDIRKLAFYGATAGHFGGVSMAISGEQGLGRWRCKVLKCDINSPLSTVLKQLNQYQPHWLMGYPSGHKILAEAQLSGKINIRPKLLVSSGEPLSRSDQMWLEDVFKCPCVNNYGSTEFHVMGGAGSGDEGMTLFDDQYFLEMADDHILVTNLFNRLLPLIRYRIDDTLRPMDARSPYGPYSVIRPVIGRNDWIPVFKNKNGDADFISPAIVGEIFIPGVWRFQMQWLDEASFRFVICINEGLSPNEEAKVVANTHAKLQEILDQRNLGNVKFTVVTADDIPINAKTGKFSLVLKADSK